jgi:spermidine synthase
MHTRAGQLSPSQVIVRRTRQGLELRVDGTLASVHREVSLRAQIVWWTLAAPAVLLRRKRRRRVLFLGFGAGSAARVVRLLDPDAELVGVERDPGVLQLARRHFGIDTLRVELIADDALHYLRRERRRFDLILEDVFIGTARTLHKPDWLFDEGYGLIRPRLCAGGLLAANTIHETPRVVRALRPLGNAILSLGIRDYWNRILVCGNNLPDPRDMRRRLAAHADFASLLPHLAVRTAI